MCVYGLVVRRARAMRSSVWIGPRSVSGMVATDDMPPSMHWAVLLSYTISTIHDMKCLTLVLVFGSVSDGPG